MHTTSKCRLTFRAVKFFGLEPPQGSAGAVQGLKGGPPSEARNVTRQAARGVKRCALRALCSPMPACAN